VFVETIADSPLVRPELDIFTPIEVDTPPVELSAIGFLFYFILRLVRYTPKYAEQSCDILTPKKSIFCTFFFSSVRRKLECYSPSLIPDKVSSLKNCGWSGWWTGHVYGLTPPLPLGQTNIVLFSKYPLPIVGSSLRSPSPQSSDGLRCSSFLSSCETFSSGWLQIVKSGVASVVETQQLPPPLTSPQTLTPTNVFPQIKVTLFPPPPPRVFVNVFPLLFPLMLAPQPPNPPQIASLSKRSCQSFRKIVSVSARVQLFPRPPVRELNSSSEVTNLCSFLSHPG